MSTAPERFADDSGTEPDRLGDRLEDRAGKRRRANDDDLRVLKPRRAAPADAVRPTRAEINLAHLRHNLRVLERAMQSASDDGTPESSPRTSLALDRPAIWGVLKADAYGHGAPAVARTLERAGIPGLCVALLEEGLELRAAGIRIPILVMGGYYGPHRDGLEEMIRSDLLPVVYDSEQIQRIATLVRSEGLAPAPIHVKVDTGMGRLGASGESIDRVLEIVAATPEVRLDGLMTHLACADADDPRATEAQMKTFGRIEERARRLGLSPRLRHAANSAALLRFPSTRFDMVRPGLALFGVAPRAGLAPELRPVMRIRSEIVALRTIEAGDRIGYGHTWQAARPSRIATVPMGYADGLNRQLSNRGHGLVRGRRVPIVGTVSMDLTMIDVTDVPHARLGEEVVFLGAQEGALGKGCITTQEIADHTGSIVWEVLTSVSRRVPRFYREP